MTTPTCDLCKSTEHIVLFKDNGSNFSYVECVNCHLIYLNPMPDRNQLDEIYPEDYQPYQKAIEEETFFLLKIIRSVNIANRRKWIERITKIKSGKIMDVGSATGIFLNEMKKHDWECTGIEPSHYAASYAKEKFQLNVLNGTLEEFELDNNQYDVITYWDVFEHTFSPSQQLEIVYKILKKNGKLVINIPNVKSFDHKLFKNSWVGYDIPRHLFVFNEIALKNYLTKHGFRLVAKKCIIPSYYGSILSLRNWLKVKNFSKEKLLFKFLYFPGIRFIFEPILAIINSLGYGTVITFFAEKI